MAGSNVMSSADFAQRSDAEILATEIKLTEVQRALALDYGFRSWRSLRDHVTWERPRTVTAQGDAYLVQFPPERIAAHLRQRPVLEHSPLTHAQHVRHQFHNERTCLEVLDDPRRPQPVLDREAGQGMTVVVGPPGPCAALGVKFRALVHNTIRGAAGAALLNAELLKATGRLERIL